MRNLIIIARNAFTETLRQPIYGILVGVTVLIFIFSPSLTMYTMDEDTELLKDTGLSTLMISGMFLAIFSAARVVTEEIENKTILTVISKTIRRSTFVLGKFLGIALAVLLAQYILCVVYLMVTRVGVEMATYEEKVDWVVEPAGWASLVLALVAPLICNYLYRWRFSTTFIGFSALLATVNLILILLFTDKWVLNPAENLVDPHLLGPIALTLMSVMVLTALAVAASTRLNMVMTLLFCSILFILGLVATYAISPNVIEQTGTPATISRLAMTALPCLNFFIATNALYQEVPVHLDYILQAALYAFFYIAGILMFAIALFRQREVG